MIRELLRRIAPARKEAAPAMPTNLEELIQHTRRLGRNYRKERVLKCGDGTSIVLSTTHERDMVTKHLKWLRGPDARATDFGSVLEGHLDWEFTLQIIRVG